MSGHRPGRDVYAKTEPTDPDPVPAYALVELTHDVTYYGTIYPRRTRGVVVHRHGNGGYEVEFERPDFAVISLTANDLRVC